MIKGAGILIIESYKGHNVVTLFGGRNDVYEDLGGHIDSGETPKETACREAREESANLLTIKPYQLDQIAHEVHLDSYASFLIYLIGLRKKYYNLNSMHIMKKCKSGHWKETIKMIRIPLRNMIRAAEQHINIVPDINGKERTIRSRTMGIIRRGRVELNAILLNSPQLVKLKKVTESRMKCLVGTWTYKLGPITKLKVPTQSIPRTSSYYTYSLKSAIFIAPRLSPMSDPYLINCDPTWGGMHITLVDFSDQNPDVLPHLNYLSRMGTRPWTINLSTIHLKQTTINFQSRTLDQIAYYLVGQGFRNVKGPNFSPYMWHMTGNCQIPYNISQILSQTTWDLVWVTNTNGVIRWHNRFMLKA